MVYEESGPTFLIVKNWATEVKRRRICTEDGLDNKRSKTTTTDENIKQVAGMVLDKRFLLAYETARNVGILKKQTF